MAASTCPVCQEKRRIIMSVGAVSEKRPKPIWRYHCKACKHSWIEDENEVQIAD